MAADTPEPPTPGQLAGLAHALDEALLRLSEMAKAAQDAGRSAMAADLWEAERSVRTARRRVQRAQT